MSLTPVQISASLPERSIVHADFTDVIVEDVIVEEVQAVDESWTEISWGRYFMQNLDDFEMEPDLPKSMLEE